MAAKARVKQTVTKTKSRQKKTGGGSGFDYEDASDIAMELKYNTAYKHKNIKVVEMEGIR